MRQIFPGYYRPSEADLSRIWQDCIFVLDANVLLNLYRYPQEARDDLKSVLSQVKTRLWVPYQAALEYQRNRISVIAEQKRRFQEVIKMVGGTIDRLEGDFSQLQLRDRHATINPDDFIGRIRPVVDDFTKKLSELEKDHGDIHDDDALRDFIDELLEGRVGQIPTVSWMDSTCKAGERRFASKTPPGFMDEGKSETTRSVYSYGGIEYHAKYGDFIIWQQMLDHAVSLDNPSIVFITDDDKKDWWWVFDSQGKKKLGPRPELVEEMLRAGKARDFYAYNSSSFLNAARKYLDAKVKDASIERVKEVRESAQSDIVDRVASADHVDVRPNADLWLGDVKIISNKIMHWLMSQPDISGLSRAEWPDFVASTSRGHIGYEILLYTNPRSLVDRLQRNYDRYRENASFTEFSDLEILVVAQEGEPLGRAISVVGSGIRFIPDGVFVSVGSMSRRTGATSSFVVFERFSNRT